MGILPEVLDALAFVFSKNCKEVNSAYGLHKQ